MEDYRTMIAGVVQMQAEQELFVEIVEQPKPEIDRFRYESERPRPKSIPGVKSTQNIKTSPSIRIRNCYTPVQCQILVSLVTKDKPYKNHPYPLVGSGCIEGVFKREMLYKPLDVITFNNFGIQRLRNGSIKDALQKRREQNINPYGILNEFEDNGKTDLNAVRLCFQVFLINENMKALRPVVSNPICDRNRAGELVIHRISHCSAPVADSVEIMMFCSKAKKNNIRVRFFECDQNNVVNWIAYGEFQETDVHKQYGIAFKVPPYKRSDIKDIVTVQIQLERDVEDKVEVGTKEYSKPIKFYYLPQQSAGCKRRKTPEQVVEPFLEIQSTPIYNIPTQGPSSSSDFIALQHYSPSQHGNEPVEMINMPGPSASSDWIAIQHDSPIQHPSNPIESVSTYTNDGLDFSMYSWNSGDTIDDVETVAYNLKNNN